MKILVITIVVLAVLLLVLAGNAGRSPSSDGDQGAAMIALAGYVLLAVDAGILILWGVYRLFTS